MQTIKIVKKDNTIEEFKKDKLFNAVKKSSERVLVEFTEEQLKELENGVKVVIEERFNGMIHVKDLHNVVEIVLATIDKAVADSYRNYRNYKTDFVSILDNVYQKAQSVLYIGDKENSNADSSLVSTKRSLITGVLMKELYQKTFLTDREVRACKDGFIYVHDMRDRLLAMNCCLADVSNIMKGGFEMGNVWYNEPKSLDTACDVLGDIIMSMASQQYGGFTVPHIDRILVPYCLKSYDTYVKELKNVVNESLLVVRGECSIDMKKIEELAMKKVRRDLEQGIQGYEIKLNTVASSRGDYPFVTFTFGAYENFPKGSLEREFAKMICEVIPEVRKNGQGAEGHKKPVLFPKLNFLYIEHLHGEDKEDEYLFDLAIQCSAKAMYPKKIGA